MWIYADHMSDSIITAITTGCGAGVLCKFCRVRESSCGKLETTFTPCLEQLVKQIPNSFFTPLLQWNTHSRALSSINGRLRNVSHLCADLKLYLLLMTSLKVLETDQFEAYYTNKYYFFELHTIFSL